MEKQRTLAASSSLTGTSLHTGEQVTLTIHPAPTGHGFKFRRKDLPDEPLIDAHVSHVRMVERATTLVEGNAKIHTVEHVLSALAGMGVDNALIEMDANEPPIGDGSAAAFVELVKQAGVVEQDAARVVFEPTEPIHIETNGSLLTIIPTKNSASPARRSAPTDASRSSSAPRSRPSFTRRKSPPRARSSSTRT